MTSTTGPGRRAFLLGVTVGVTGLIAGCTSGGPDPHPSPTPAPPSPDELAAGRAVRSARALLTAAAGGTAGDASRRLAALLGALADVHREHLSALGLPDPAASPGSSSPGASSTGTPSPAGATGTTPTGTAAPSGTAPQAPVRPAVLAAAEWSGAGEAFADVAITTPATAGLLARIAAARAVDADLIRGAAGLQPLGDLAAAVSGGTPAPPGASGTSTGTSTGTSSGTSSVSGASSAPPAGPEPSPSSTSLDTAGAAALSALLSGEHAATYAYGLIVARAPAAREKLARSLWEAHRRRRDELERRLVATGRTPAPAGPAYDVGTVPATAAQLAAFAARVEDGLAAAAFGAVTRTAGTVRSEAAADLVRAARRAATWRGSPVALPGSPS